MYKTVAGFSPDSTDFNDDLLDSRINKNQFLEELFSPRDAVGLIREEIFVNPNNLICLAGPRGSGKTSIGLKAKQELISRKAFKNLVIPIDVRRDDAVRNISGLSTQTQFFTSKILNRFKKEFRPTPWDMDNNPEIHLISYILDPTISENKPEELFLEFEDEINDAIDLQYKYYRKEKPENYRTWLVEKFLETDIQELIKKVKSKITIIHYSFAVQALFNYKRQIIWIDNIDKLPNDDQVWLLESITELKRAVTDNIVLVVAVREENIYRVEHFENFAPPHITTIYWENPKAFENAQSYDAFNMPVVKDEVFTDIVERRFSFARTLQIQIITRIKNEIRILQNELNSVNNQKILEFNEMLHILGEPIEDKYFLEIERLMKKIIKTMLDEKAYYLTNNSLRELLPLHREFLLHLVDRDDNSATSLEANKFSPWFLQTEFLYFITLHSRNSTFIHYDIVNHCSKPNRTKKKKIVCFCPHLVLTIIWNLSISNIRKVDSTINLPTVQQIIDKLMPFEFEKDEILETIFKLFYSPNGKSVGKSNYITIETSDNVKTFEQINPNSRLKINYKGKSVLNNLSISFGYFYALVINKDGFDDEHLDPSKSVQYGMRCIKTIKEIAQDHLNSLLSIRSIIYKNREDWIDSYYLTYGIPFHPRFSRNYNMIGKRIVPNSRYKHALYIEALLDSFIPYFSNFRAVNEQLTLLRDKYSRGINGIANFKLNTFEEIKLLEL